MYGFGSYVRRGYTFFHNQWRPQHKHLSTLMLYATDLCDSACKHCLIWAKRPAKHLPLKVVQRLLKQNRCVSRHTRVGLEGGEFMLHPEAHDILFWMRKHHPNFDLLSNCLQPASLIEAVKKVSAQTTLCFFGWRSEDLQVHAWQGRVWVGDSGH